MAALAGVLAALDDSDGRHVVVVTDRPELLSNRTGALRRYLAAAPSVAVIAIVPGRRRRAAAVPQRAADRQPVHRPVVPRSGGGDGVQPGSRRRRVRGRRRRCRSTDRRASMTRRTPTRRMAHARRRWRCRGCSPARRTHCPRRLHRRRCGVADRLPRRQRATQRDASSRRARHDRRWGRRDRSGRATARTL